MSQTKLPADKVEEIQLEANALYPKKGIIGYAVKNYAYVEGATSEAEKAAEQLSSKDKEIEALKAILKSYGHTFDGI